MRTLNDLRAEHPAVAFEMRPLPQPDGTVYLMTMPLWYWRRLEVVLMTGPKTLSKITDFCLSLAHRAVEDEGWALENAYRELLMYYIYRHFQGYINARDNLSNDNWDNCFLHLP